MLERLLAGYQTEAFSYSSVGGTQGGVAEGYKIDHNRVLIGHGPDQFKAAKAAIDAWRMFALDWIEIFPALPSVQVGATVAVVVRHLGFWSVNISRIVYLLNEETRYGFAYVTLP